jgi:hypothetical protein
MRPRRPRGARRGRAPRQTGHYVATSGGVGGGELVQAAEEIADGARSNASWSTTIPGNIRTEQVDDNHVNIVADAPPAYPNETNSRHPVFARGDDRTKWTWTAGNNRPFLAPAAEQRAGAALDKFALRADRLVEESGL